MSSLLQELSYANATDLTIDLNELENQLNNIIDKLTTLNETSYPAMNQNNMMDELLSMMDTAMKKMSAAKRGLGFVNKLTPGPSRAKHASRVMKNMNSIRGLISRITNDMQQTDDTGEETVRSDRDTAQRRHHDRTPDWV